MLGGVATSTLLVLNYTYETEKLKQALGDEVETLNRMKDFELDDVASFRSQDFKVRKQLASSGLGQFDNMQTHYHYFWGCAANAVRQSVFSFSFKPHYMRLKSNLKQLKGNKDESETEQEQ